MQKSHFSHWQNSQPFHVPVVEEGGEKQEHKDVAFDF